MQAYQHRLGRLGMIDWWDVPRRYWHWLQEGRIAPPHYDVVLVDEAQFFAPVWFDVVRAMVTPEVGYLMLAADPTQGFLRRGASWRSVAGVDMRGRSHVLRRSYRTTRAIMALALAFYRLRLPENTPTCRGRPRRYARRAGAGLFEVRCTAGRARRSGQADRGRSRPRAASPPRPDPAQQCPGRGAMVEALNEKLRSSRARSQGRTSRLLHPGTTLNAGTGPESPVVFAMDSRSSSRRSTAYVWTKIPRRAGGGAHPPTLHGLHAGRAAPDPDGDGRAAPITPAARSTGTGRRRPWVTANRPAGGPPSRRGELRNVR